jgi:putative ABC transport system permease protein
MFGIDWANLTPLEMAGLAVAAILVVFVVIPFLIVTPFFLILGGTEVAARLASLVADATGAFGLSGRLGALILGVPKFFILIFKSLRRNLVRTSLTYLATFLLVLIVSFIWSVLSFLDAQMRERAKDVKVIVSEKFQLPSMMPPSYENRLGDEAARLPEGMAADPAKDVMAWSFVGCQIDPDPNKRTIENILFFFALRPKTLLSMMNDIELKDLSPADQEMMKNTVAAMESNIGGVILGVERLRTLNKKVGDRLKVYCFNYRDIDFEIEIVGTFPAGTRYDTSAAMNIDYFRRKLDAYERAKGQRHPLAEKSLNYFWARFPEKEGFERYAEVVSRPGSFSSPSVKAEMGSAAIASFLEAWKDILWAMRYLMGPGIVATMIVIVANAISIGVRERQKEMAVLKVLGFRPWQILVLVLGEALIVGVLSGTIAAFGGWYLINQVAGGIPLPIAFFGRFRIADAALWWGPAVGALTALCGSFLPAWSARTVRVSEVFSKVT